jgi:hypothetical protein
MFIYSKKNGAARLDDDESFTVLCSPRKNEAYVLRRKAATKVYSVFALEKRGHG